MEEVSPQFRCRAKNGRTRIRHKALYLEAPRRPDWKSIHKKRRELRELRLIHEDTIPALQAAIQEELQGLDAVLVDPAKAKIQDALASGTITDLENAITAESAGPFDAVQSRNIEQLHKEEPDVSKLADAAICEDALEEEPDVSKLADAAIGEDALEVAKSEQKEMGSTSRVTPEAAGKAEAVGAAKACKINEDDICEANDVLLEELRKANAREGLQRATWSCSILDLRSAISEAEDAGLDEEETMVARQMLGIEERKEEARNGLETAVQSRSPEMLEDALEEADRCGLNPKETEMARRVLTEDPSLDEQATASPASSNSEIVTPPVTPEALVLDHWIQIEVLEITRDQENIGRQPKHGVRRDWPAIKDKKRATHEYEFYSDGESHSEYEEMARDPQTAPRKRFFLKNQKQPRVTPC